MSADLDALAESARNRGLKLARSRVRTPGKGDFGKVGLSDAAGKPVFGIDGKTLTASPAEVEEYLRSLGAADWNASLGVAKGPSRKVPRKPPPKEERREPAVKLEPEPEPEPEPRPIIRAATPGDAAGLVSLLALLGHEADAGGVRERLRLLARQDEAPLVAVVGDELAGLCGIHRMTVVHRPAPVGRITILAVAEARQGTGIGRMLVERAEAALLAAGCGMVEITSNDRLARAHAFYRHMGYERTSMRFAKLLQAQDK